MSELMTSLDVVNQTFKKTLRGYDSAEVDEFLDRVAECLQVYAQRTKDCERDIETHLEKLADYDRLKDSLQETLLMAQRTAEERVANATGMADSIVAEARAKADALISDARARAEGIIRKSEEDVSAMNQELGKLDAMRASGFAVLKDLMGQMSSAIGGAEADGRLRFPEFIQNLGADMVKKPAPSSTRDRYEEPAPETADKDQPKKLGISDTLAALGLDPKLLETDPTGK